MSMEHLPVDHLQALRAEVADIRADTASIRRRMHSIDASFPDLGRHDTHLHEDIAHHQVTMAKVPERVQRTEKRLELS